MINLADKYCKESYQLSLELDKTDLINGCLVNLSNIFIDKKQYKTALSYIKNITIDKYNVLYDQIMFNKGIIYLELGIIFNLREL